MQLPASALLRGSTVVGDGQRVAQQFPHMAIVETVISRAMSHPNVVQVGLRPGPDMYCDGAAFHSCSAMDSFRSEHAAGWCCPCQQVTGRAWQVAGDGHAVLLSWDGVAVVK